MRLLAVALGTGTLAGCVERRYVVYTDPPSAMVLRNGQPIGGPSPSDDHFVYYGNYHFTIIKEGYETLQVDQMIPTPWYEYFPLDFISENLVPWMIEDRREFHYRLEPRRVVNTDEMLKDAQNLRNRGLSLGPGVPPATPAVPAVATPAAIAPPANPASPGP
jgi:hypothetical protein